MQEVPSGQRVTRVRTGTKKRQSILDIIGEVSARKDAKLDIPPARGNQLDLYVEVFWGYYNIVQYSLHALAHPLVQLNGRWDEVS